MIRYRNNPIFPVVLLVLTPCLVAPAIAQSSCSAKFSSSSYEIDEKSGIAEYAGTIKPQNCDNGCSGELMLEFQYAVSKQKTENSLKPIDRNSNGNPFNEKTVVESETQSATEPRAVSWKSKAGEDVDLEGSSNATRTLCQAAMGAVCRPLKLKASGYQRCQQSTSGKASPPTKKP